MAKKNSIHQQMLLRRASRSEFKDGLLRHNQRQENRLLLELEQWEKAQRMVARGLDKESTRFKQSAASTGYGPPPRLPKRNSLSELTENGQPRFIPDYQYRNRATIAAQPGFTDFEPVPRTDQQTVVPSENSNDASQQQQQRQQYQQNQKQQQKEQYQQQQQQEEKQKKKDSEHESSKSHRHTTHGKSSEGDEGKKSERRSSSDKHGDHHHHHHHHHRSSSHSHKKSKHHREEHDSQGKETAEREKEKKKKAESGKTRSEDDVPGDEKKVSPLTIAAVEGSSSALVNNKHNHGHQPAPTSKPTSHPKPSTKPRKKTSLDTTTPLLLTPHPNSSSTTTSTTATTTTAATSLTDTDIMDGVLAQFGMDDSRPDTLSKTGARSFSICEDVHDPGDVVVSHRTVRDFGWDGRRRYNNVWDNLSAPKHTSQVRSVRSRLQREFTQIPPPSREGSSRALAVRSGSARAPSLS